MKLIELSKSGTKHKGKYFAQVDDDMFEYLNQWNWFFMRGNTTNYARRNQYSPRSNGKKRIKTILMHRFIMGVTDPKIKVDHKDHNGFNNRKYNIRTATHNQNISNTTSRKNSSSKYLGVCWVARLKRWVAQIQFNKNKIHIGCYLLEEDAARAYDKKATELFGEFANLNFKDIIY